MAPEKGKAKKRKGKESNPVENQGLTEDGGTTAARRCSSRRASRDVLQNMQTPSLNENLEASTSGTQKARTSARRAALRTSQNLTAAEGASSDSDEDFESEEKENGSRVASGQPRKTERSAKAKKRPLVDKNEDSDSEFEDDSIEFRDVV